MKYILINDIKKNSKEIRMPQNGLIFHVSMWWVAKNIKFNFNHLSKYLVIQLGIFLKFILNHINLTENKI
jgi:hypothetical protein